MRRRHGPRPIPMPTQIRTRAAQFPLESGLAACVNSSLAVLFPLLPLLHCLSVCELAPISPVSVAIAALSGNSLAPREFIVLANITTGTTVKRRNTRYNFNSVCASETRKKLSFGFVSTLLIASTMNFLVSNQLAPTLRFSLASPSFYLIR